MIATLALAGLLATTPDPQPWTAQTALPVRGLATFYAPTVMERVYAYRLQRGELQPCPECVGHVAMPRAGDIGRRVWLIYRGRKTGPYLVVDCSQERDFKAFAEQHVLEVDWPTAIEWEMAGPITLTVAGRGPAPP